MLVQHRVTLPLALKRFLLETVRRQLGIVLYIKSLMLCNSLNSDSFFQRPHSTTKALVLLAKNKTNVKTFFLICKGKVNLDLI